MRPLLALPALLFLLACGGNRVGTDASAGLLYSDPAAGEWRLVQDPSSSPERLVLTLLGPAGLKTRGATFTLLADASQVRFLPFSDGSYVQSAGVYATTAAGRPEESRVLQLVVGGVQGGKLTAGLFQKDLREPAQDSGRALFRIALAAQPGMAPGTTVSLLLRKAAYVPDDLAATQYRPLSVPVAIGKLVVP